MSKYGITALKSPQSVRGFFVSFLPSFTSSTQKLNVCSSTGFFHQSTPKLKYLCTFFTIYLQASVHIFIHTCLGARCSPWCGVSLWYNGSSDRSFMVDPLSYFSFQPVFHDWCNKGLDVCHSVYGIVHIKEPLLLIGKRGPL